MWKTIYIGAHLQSRP